MKRTATLLALVLTLSMAAGCSVPLGGRRVATTANALVAGAGVALLAAGATSDRSNTSDCRSDDNWGPCIRLDGRGTLAVIGLSLVASGLVGLAKAADEDVPAYEQTPSNR